MTNPFPGQERAKHMGELRRGDQRWDVYVEAQPADQAGGAKGGPVRGRIHFVSGERHRVTTWIFLEWQERDIHERFAEFSAVELLRFVEALDD